MEFFAPSHVRPAAPYGWPVPGVNGGGIASVQESEHGDDGGDHCETTLEAKSTANHCGGTALLSDSRAAWAVELGLDEIHGLMVLVPVVPRPCQLERGVWLGGPGCGTQCGTQCGCAAWPVDARNGHRYECQRHRQELHDAEVCKRSACAARTRGGGTESPQAAAKPMMARVRKWTVRCLSATVVSFFCLVRVSVFCSILTWNVPNLLCQAETLWS